VFGGNRTGRTCSASCSAKLRTLLARALLALALARVEPLRGLQEAEQLSLGSASAAKVRRRRTRRGLQEAEQTRASRAIATQSEPYGNPEGVA